jgi:hypothetical protein
VRMSPLAEAEIQTAKHRLRPLRRHLSVRRAEMQCERDPQTHIARASRRTGSRAQGSAAEMLEHYPQERGARFAEGGGRFTGMPRMTLRLRYPALKLRAPCRVSRRLRKRRGRYPEVTLDDITVCFSSMLSSSPVMRSARASSPQRRTPVQGVFSGCQGSVIQLALGFSDCGVSR